MSFKKIHAALLALGVTLLGGCTTEQGRFSIISNHDVEISRVDLKHADLQRDVSASDGRAWFLFIPLGTTPTVNDAIDKCLKEGRGDYMTSVRVKSTWWTILLISWESYRVTGDVGNSMGANTGEIRKPPPPVRHDSDDRARDRDREGESVTTPPSSD